MPRHPALFLTLPALALAAFALSAKAQDAPAALSDMAPAALSDAAPASLSDVAPAEAAVEPVWAIAEWGEPLYKDGIDHWPYVNPDAPKGGKITLGSQGSFDSLNPYIIKGDVFYGVSSYTGCQLMEGSSDEIMAAYGSVAQSVEVAPDKSWMIAHLRPEARWADGAPLTADDFKYAYDIIMDKRAQPFLRSFYAEISGLEVIDPQTLRFTFSTRDSMKPVMVAAQHSPIPRHWFEAPGHDIWQSYLEAPVGCGAYEVAEVDAPRMVRFRRVADWWGEKLPVNVGTSNFDEIQVDFYLDPTAMIEALKAGKIDFRAENSAKRWATGYDDLAPIKDGRMIKRAVPNEVPQGLQSFVINQRQPKFATRAARRALQYLFDFETVQRTLLYGQYSRSETYFPKSDYGSHGLPEGEELAVLEPFRDQLPPELFTDEFHVPRTDGSGNIRENLRAASALLDEAGFRLVDGKRVDPATGQQLEVEFMLDSGGEFERLVQPFIDNLKKAGINGSIRVVDSAQYQSRLDQFDFDIVVLTSNFFPPPGPELRSYFGSTAADEAGTGNWYGIKNPVVDQLVEEIISAPSLEALKVRTRALDRVLLWGFYNIPQWHNDQDRLVYWNRFDFPTRKPRYSVGFPGAWWAKAGGKPAAQHVQVSPWLDADGKPAADAGAMPAEPPTPTMAPEPAKPERKQGGYGWLAALLAACVVALLVYGLQRRRARG